MPEAKDEFINQIERFVQNELRNHDGSHDWWHIHRVRNNALTLAKHEGITSKEDLQIIEVASLLHDVRDWKYAKEQRGSLEDVVEDILKDYPHKKTTLDVINNMDLRKN